MPPDVSKCVLTLWRVLVNHKLTFKATFFMLGPLTTSTRRKRRKKKKKTDELCNEHKPFMSSCLIILPVISVPHFHMGCACQLHIHTLPVPNAGLGLELWGLCCKRLKGWMCEMGHQPDVCVALSSPPLPKQQHNFHFNLMCPWALDGLSSAGTNTLERISKPPPWKMEPGTVNVEVRQTFVSSSDNKQNKGHCQVCVFITSMSYSNGLYRGELSLKEQHTLCVFPLHLKARPDISPQNLQKCGVNFKTLWAWKV